MASWLTFQSPSATSRSEEHTSELQSQSNLVCRLLLENKHSSYGLKKPVHTTQLKYHDADGHEGEIGRLNAKTHEERLLNPLPRNPQAQPRFPWHTPAH